jgi:sec-independent protein translocase protein TatB
MLDIGWAELLVVGVVALLVVGPKELPGMLRTLGQYIGMIRRQANEFKQQFNDAIKDTELDEIRKEVDAIRSDTAQTVRDVQSSVRVSDSDIGAAKTAEGAEGSADPTWMTEGAQPSPAEAAALAAAERAERLRSGEAATTKSSASASGETQPSATTRPQTADAGA